MIYLRSFKMEWNPFLISILAIFVEWFCIFWSSLPCSSVRSSNTFIAITNTFIPIIPVHSNPPSPQRCYPLPPPPPHLSLDFDYLMSRSQKWEPNLELNLLSSNFILVTNLRRDFLDRHFLNLFVRPSIDVFRVSRPKLDNFRLSLLSRPTISKNLKFCLFDLD